jgi:hypothetical protein
MPRHSEIVGAFYRPYGELILSHLPLHAELFLVPEPTNPHDTNAIAVWVSSEEILKSQSQSFDGQNDLDLLNTEFHHIGYLPRTVAETLKPQWPHENGEPQSIAAYFTILSTGKYGVIFDL